MATEIMFAQLNALKLAVHGHAENLLEWAEESGPITRCYGGKLELTRKSFPDYEGWRHWRDEGLIEWNTAIGMGRIWLMDILEEAANHDVDAYTSPIRVEYLQAVGVDLEAIDNGGRTIWKKEISPRDLMHFVKDLWLNAALCDYCNQPIGKETRQEKNDD